MKSVKQLGIWMDHSNAYLTAYTEKSVELKMIASQPEFQEDAQNTYKDESHSLNKDQGQLSAYFKKIGEVILGFEDVILFGPTDAKSELFNQIKQNPLFDEIRIAVKPSDNMTEAQRHAFVLEYFSTHNRK